MDELEARLVALEALVVDRLALDDTGRLEQLRAMVEAWPEGDPRAQALQWLDEATQRFDEFTTGRRIGPKP